MKSGTKKVDVDRLKDSINIVDVIGRHVDLEHRSGEFYGICPFHDDHKKSLQVNERKQIFKCFACGVGGDAIDFFTQQGMEFKEACEAAAGGSIKPDSLQPERRPTARKKPKWTQIKPAPNPAKKKQAVHSRLGKPSSVWKWHDKNGDLTGYTCRFDHKDGKDILPLTYQKSDDFEGWRWKGFEAPRDLYNMPELIDRPTAPVLVVEGEKCVEAAKGLLPDLVVTSWMGGARAIEKTDWSPLHGRKAVYLWPDNDDPGREAMRHIGDMIADQVTVVKGIANPEKSPEHWDVADANWTADQTREYVKNNVFTMSGPEPDPDDGPPSTMPPDFEEDETAYLPTENEFFKFLGFEMNSYGQQNFRFYVKSPKVTFRITASGMGETNLMTLAPINWWEDYFPKKSGFDIRSARNWLIQKSHEIGHFDDKLIRGRGAWMDQRRVVIHSGNMLIVDGKQVELGQLDTKYIYESSESLDFKTRDPLSKDEATKLVDLCERLPWKRSINAPLLAGWCVIAPICGILPWRPHIWLTGATGTGKSWIFQNIVSRLIGETGYSVQSETTEAGLRQLLQHDALPVIFDEAEGEDRRAGERMDNVMALMRAASSDDGGIMVKGTSGGQAKTYQIRSCFAFASINVQVKHQSDRTRVTILEMARPPEKGKQKRWRKFVKDWSHLITDEFVDRLQARIINMIPIIHKNAKTFAAAAAAHLGEQRQGDQLGALFAGAYALVNDGLITFDHAIGWLKMLDEEQDTFREERLLEETRDEMMLFTHLMDQIVRVDGYHGTVQRQIGEMVKLAQSGMTASDMGATDAKLHLSRHGFKVEGDFLYISNYSDFIKKLLRDTAWAKNHNKILLRIDGATSAQDVRFESGTKHRAVKIPLNIIA